MSESPQGGLCRAHVAETSAGDEDGLIGLSCVLRPEKQEETGENNTDATGEDDEGQRNSKV